MIETYKVVLILIVYTAILLLIIFYLYPLLKNLFKRKISISIQIGAEEKEVKEKVVKPKKQEEIPSILGKSKFVLSQPLPNAATDLETENRTEKEHTFVPEMKKPEDENINRETGEGLDISEEETASGENPDVDLNDEEESVGVGNMQDERASGIDYNELGVTAKTIANPENSKPSDEELAGKVLLENQYTQLVKSIQDSSPENAKRITELIDMRERIYAETQEKKTVVSRKNKKLYESEDFKNFSVDDVS
jgi:hypothetical protein